MKLTEFDQTDYERYPFVENFCGEIIPLLAQVKMAPPGHEGWHATVVVDGNGILVLIYNEKGEQRMVFCRELSPFPLAALVAEHLEAPLDPKALTRLGFEQFK